MLERATTPDEFEAKVLRSDRPTLAYFSATWCGFCKGFLPTVEATAKKEPNWKFVEVLIDEDSNPLWDRFSIQSVPTILFFKDGNVMHRLDGISGRGLNAQMLSAAITEASGKIAPPQRVLVRRA